MSTAKSGDTVAVRYTGKLEDGQVFDSSEGRDPLRFTIGDNKVIPGFEKVVVGMSTGDTRTTKIPADEAFGQYEPEKVMVVDREKFPPEITPEIGTRLEMVREDGEALPITITDVSDAEVTIDANHPLAGKDLTFEIELVEIL